MLNVVLFLGLLIFTTFECLIFAPNGLGVVKGTCTTARAHYGVLSSYIGSVATALNHPSPEKMKFVLSGREA